jgi:hypothetical protein
MVLWSASHLVAVTTGCHNRGGAKQLYGVSPVSLPRHPTVTGNGNAPETSPFRRTGYSKRWLDPRRVTDHPATALLAVEVSLTTLSYDLTTKAELYATAAIPEYWMPDLEGRQLHVFRDPAPLPPALGATAYTTHLTYSPGDTVHPLHAATVVTVADLLP